MTVTLVIELVCAVVARLTWGAIGGFLVCLVGATAGGVVSFVITDIALIVLGRRERLQRALWTVVVPVISIALLGVSIYGNFFPAAFPTTIGPIAVLVCMVAGFGYAAARRRRVAAVEPVRLDVLEPELLLTDRE